MQISSIKLRGFRNFRDTSVELSKNSLVIGYNDVGKTNFTYALRILLDKNLPDSALEPKDSDFFVHEETNELEITIRLVDVVEDCLLSRFRDHVSEDGELFLSYRAYRRPDTRKKTYKLFVGFHPDNMSEIQNRFYLRVLNLRFIEGKRDLLRYIRRERQALLEDAKGSRTDQDIAFDDTILGEIEHHLRAVNSAITRLNYVSTATTSLNAELLQLSYRHVGQEIVFDTGATEPSEFVDDLELVAKVQGKSIGVGGDGRTNQIQLALWTARNQMAVADGEDPDEVSVFCIEEPEAHLHPHQQRKLASYLATSLQSQVILTTHSPQITVEFPPSSIIRLHDTRNGTEASGGGATPIIESNIVEFGYRMNVIPAEAFFASAVLLVEGPSEVLFYKALARQINLDLDRLNISILSVDGVGFKPYASLLSTLNIPFAVRTDNDLMKIPRSEKFRFAGIERGIELCRLYRPTMNPDTVPQELVALLREVPDRDEIPLECAEAASTLVVVLEAHGLFIAKDDLENDLYNEITDVIHAFLGSDNKAGAIAEMKSQKATFMFDFLMTNAEALRPLAQSEIARPLHYCRGLVEG